MTRPELGEVLLELVEAIHGAAGEAQMLVDEATIELPLECSMHVERGAPVFRASAPHSRFRSGFLPTVHKTRLRIVPLPRAAVDGEVE